MIISFAHISLSFYHIFKKLPIQISCFFHSFRHDYKINKAFIYFPVVDIRAGKGKQ